MENELYAPNSILRETFERKGGDDMDDDIDIDTNLLKYLLESHAADGDGSGPASLFLSQLGLQFPTVPETKLKK